MKLSIQKNIIGKPVAKEVPGGRPYYVCNNRKVNLGYGWMNIECDWETCFELITSDGLATSAELVADHRTDDNFVSRQLCMVDIDNGMTLQELFENDFYNEFGAGFYTTASHTDDKHRFRIMFISEEPITNKEKMKKLIRGLLTIYESGDKSCKDASRIYYGVPQCVLKEKRNKILPNYIIDELVNLIELNDAKTEKIVYTPKEDQTIDEIFVEELLKRIQYKNPTFKGDYYTWRSVAWATCHAIGKMSAKHLMMRYWPKKTKECLQTLESWKTNSSPTLGTLVKLSGINSTERTLLEVQAKLRKIK